MTSLVPRLALRCRRAEVRAFWLVIVVLGAVTGALAGAAAGAPVPSVWSGTAALALLIPRLVFAPWFELGVRAWNKGVRLCSAPVRSYVLFVTYYVLVVPASWTGSTLDKGGRPSGWIAWPPETVVHSETPGPGTLPASSWWAVALGPSRWLLSLFAEDRAADRPISSSYTLY